MQAHIRIQIANGNIERETAKAVKFDFGWMPKSQIIIDLDTHYDASGSVFIPVWLAKKNGLGWGHATYTANEMSEILATSQLQNIRE